MTFREAFDPFRALRAGWQLFLKAPLTLLLGGFLLALTGGGGGGGGGDFGGSSGGRMSEEEMVILLVVGCVVCVLTIGFFLLRCLLLIGFPNAIERVASRGEEELGDLFRAKGLFLSMVLVSILSFVILLASVLPGVLIGLVSGGLAGVATGEEGVGVAVGLLAGGIVALPVFVYVHLGIVLAPSAVALEGMAPMESLRRSWDLVRGNRLSLLLYAIVMFVVTMLGLLLCCVGIIATTAIAQAAWAESYLRLVRTSEQQAGWWLDGAAPPEST